MTSDERRFPLANERTFLAWVRTSLALIGGGLAVEALELSLAGPLRLIIAVLLLLAGLACAAQAWRGWARTERAMRHSTPLPSSGLKLPVAVILGIVALAVLLGVLL